MKIIEDFKKFMEDNMKHAIEEANSNIDCPGFAILMPNYSVNTRDFRGEELDWLWDELQQEYGVALEVSDFDDLVVYTDQYEPFTDPANFRE